MACYNEVFPSERLPVSVKAHSIVSCSDKIGTISCEPRVEEETHCGMNV